MMQLALTVWLLPAMVHGLLQRQQQRQSQRFPRLSHLYDCLKDDAAAASSAAVPYDEQLLYMGISQEWDELKKGDSLIKEFLPCGLVDDTSNLDDDDDNDTTRSITIQKLSQRPPLFLLKGILTPEECQKLQDLALSSGPMQEATTRSMTEDNNNKEEEVDNEKYRQASQFAWIPNDRTGLTRLAHQVHAIFLPHEPCYHPIVSVEEMQVVHYDPQGRYDFHHDGAMRILTVLYYLNAVSDTWFPLADWTHGRFMTRDHAIEAAAALLSNNNNNNQQQKVGVCVSQIQPGDAIAFYNYFQNGTLEWNAWHAGLPASSDKWIATHWYHHVSPSQCSAMSSSSSSTNSNN
jgi:2OG-Fe(II) oxygenase superfamily